MNEGTQRINTYKQRQRTWK